jgi:hypothetical protein
VLKRSFNLQSEKLENATLKITLDKWAPSRHVNAVEIYGTSAPWSEHGQDRGAALIEPMRRSQY